jgi:hypothetical protein
VTTAAPVKPSSSLPSAPTELVEFLPEAVPVTDFAPDEHYFSFHELPPFPVPWRHPLRAIGWTVSLLFGLASLVLLLAVIAAIPLLNFVALGYLLEAEGRVARTGKLRYALPLLPLAPRLGGIAFGIWFWLLMVRLVADAASDAQTIAPGTGIAVAWRLGLLAVSMGVGLHILLALSRGGGFWCFFRPIKNVRWLWSQLETGGYFVQAEAAVREFVVALRIPHHFWLGLRGFVGTLAWLFVPTVLFAALQDPDKPGQVLFLLIGGVLLMLVLTWVPFLQAHFAAQNRIGAFRELRTIRELWRRTPLACFLAVVVLYALSLPLYLFKIAAPPRDALWFFTLIFVMTIYPAKILVAWAYARAVRKEKRQWLAVRWSCNVALVPLLAFYLFLLFFTPAIGAAGRRVLFDHHALLLPTPF